MDRRMELERLCIESWDKLDRTERALGIASTEASIFRAEWSAFDRAYRLLYNERIDYYNIGV